MRDIISLIQTYEVIALISEENAKVLAFFVQHAEDGVPEDRIPKWIDGRRIADLHAKKLLERRTVVPPGKEPLYPRGLSAYAIPPAGKDALFEYQRAQDKMREQAAKRRADEDKRIRERLADKRHDWAIAIFSALGGSAITLFIEHVITPLFH